MKNFHDIEKIIEHFSKKSRKCCSCGKQPTNKNYLAEPL